MKDDIYSLYVLGEMYYKRKNITVKEEDLFPADWYSFNNYRAKIDVLAEATKNGILIKDTKKYQEMHEGVKNIVK